MLLVTGGGRGIGAAVAFRAALAGESVCVNYRQDAVGARAVVARIRADGGSAIAVQADVADQRDVRRLFATAEDALGRLTKLVNNAGDTGGPSLVIDTTAEQIDSCFRSTFRSVALCSGEAARRMAKSRGGNGGAIVNIASTAARTGGSGEWVHYAALKSAVLTHTIGAARELAAVGIRVNAVSPGLVATNLHAANGMPDRPDRLRSTVPLGRLAEPDEIAEAVWFLCSDAASYAAGAVIEICGAR